MHVLLESQLNYSDTEIINHSDRALYIYSHYTRVIYNAQHNRLACASSAPPSERGPPYGDTNQSFNGCQPSEAVVLAQFNYNNAEEYPYAPKGPPGPPWPAPKAIECTKLEAEAVQQPPTLATELNCSTVEGKHSFKEEEDLAASSNVEIEVSVSGL